MVKATCPMGTIGGCGGRITIKSQKRLVTKKGQKKGKVYTLGSAKYLIAPGKTQAIELKVPSAAVKALKFAKKVIGIATITSADTAGHSASKRVKVTFKYKG